MVLLNGGMIPLIRLGGQFFRTPQSVKLLMQGQAGAQARRVGVGECRERSRPLRVDAVGEIEHVALQR